MQENRNTEQNWQKIKFGVVFGETISTTWAAAWLYITEHRADWIIASVIIVIIIGNTSATDASLK